MFGWALSEIAEIAAAIGAAITAIGVVIGLIQLYQNRAAIKHSTRITEKHAGSLSDRAGIAFRNKRIDVILHCNLRYETLYNSRLEIDELVRGCDSVQHDLVQGMLSSHDMRRIDAKRDLIEDKTIGYFRRYWGLKSDQLDYWLAGYVDPDTVASWFMSVVAAFSHDSRKVGALSYWEGWEKSKEAHAVVDRVFTNLVDDIRKIAQGPEDKEGRYDKLLRKLERIEADKNAMIKMLERLDLTRMQISDLRKLRSHA